MKLVACVAIIATAFSVSPMRSWADYIVKKLKITSKRQTTRLG